MQAGQNETLILPAPPEPFALIVGLDLLGKPLEIAETALRHMGLRPERVDIGDDPRFAAPQFRLHFASMTLIAGRASASMLDRADPQDPATSLLAASLPRDWRGEGHCWIFQPEVAHEGQASPVRMRELFKTMVLLIDLFDASHIFWSPAQLWSDAPQFRAATAEMLVSGMPPVLHLVVFRRGETEDGAVMRTRGLASFGGQELEAKIPPGWTVAEMIKRLARLALDIMLNGPLSEPQRIRGIEAGEWASLSPSEDSEPRGSTLHVDFRSHR